MFRSSLLIPILLASLLSFGSISVAGSQAAETVASESRSESNPIAITGELAAADDSKFQQHVLPVLADRCGKCHGSEIQEAGVRFDTLSSDFANRSVAQTWREARNAINSGDMPPEDEPPLTAGERKTVIDWITQTMKATAERQKSTGGRVVMRRLNQTEYQNTMFDLLGLDMNYTRDLPPDSLSPDGFRNNGQSLRMSALQLEYYLDTARRALEKVIVTGGPPKVFRHQFKTSNVGGWRGPTEKSNKLERSQKFLAKIVDDYPETGEFRVRVQARAMLRNDKGFPLLECAVGYRPDTEVYFRIAGTKEVVSEDLQQFEFRGRIENFPLPVRGQGKYPGLVIRLMNAYDDGTPRPSKLETIKRDGQEFKAFRAEPDLPHLSIESVEFEGPVYSEWPPRTHRQILFNSALRDDNEVEYLRQVLERFMTRAFRRPPGRREVEDMFSFFATIRPHFIRFEDAVRETLAMVLIQPDFLYLMEPAGELKRRVGDWELASRLSYFLWSTMPDRALLDLAEQGLLSQPQVLEAQVERMLSDERAMRFVEQFTSQWLRLDGVDIVSVDSEYYPQFDNALKADLRSETTRYFAELLYGQHSAVKLLRSDFTMLNERLARHYGVPGVLGNEFRVVRLSGERRVGGLLGQGSVLLANSNGQDSHPIRRAVWIRDRLLNDPPAPPPPNVPELDEANPGFAKLSVREQLEVHREKESCRSCHRNIDPWGIALEHFDAVGLWRDNIRKRVGDSFDTRPVAAVDSLPNGIELNGAGGLQDYLVKNRTSQFADALVRNLSSYALGRSLELTDEEDIVQLSRDFATNGYSLKRLVKAIVASNAFLTK